jgi:Zn finger protein HypA/HybF involved in hydrogenase expression
MKEGTLFVFQHTTQGAKNVVGYCPVCGSKKLRVTGREFDSIEENAPISEPAN